MRATTVIYEGAVESLKCGNEMVTAAKTNQEVGIALGDKDIRFENNDTVQVFERVNVQQVIPWNPPGF